jgi:hypothetical protein
MESERSRAPSDEGHLAYEKGSTLFIIREIQIKTTMSYYFTSSRMAIISSTHKCWIEFEKLKFLYNAVRM